MTGNELNCICLCKLCNVRYPACLHWEQDMWRRSGSVHASYQIQCLLTSSYQLFAHTTTVLVWVFRLHPRGSGLRHRQVWRHRPQKLQDRVCLLKVRKTNIYAVSFTRGSDKLSSHRAEVAEMGANAKEALRREEERRICRYGQTSASRNPLRRVQSF